MAYVVPKELPKTCSECVFCQCKFSYPLWAEREPENLRNKQGFYCALDTQKPKRIMIVEFGDKTKKMEWCPLKETAEVVRCKDCKCFRKGKPFRHECKKVCGGIFYPNPDDFCSYGERRSDV